MNNPLENGPQGLDSQKNVESLPNNPKLEDLKDNHKNTINIGLQKIDKSEELANNNEQQEKIYRAKNMLAKALDAAMEQFIKEKDQTKPAMEGIGENYIKGILADPNFPGLDVLKDQDVTIKSRYMRSFHGVNYNLGIHISKDGSYYAGAMAVEKFDPVSD